ncbi:MAG: ComF family protein, partial [Deltaproteobacteria bacterium]|jgi:ComF family protein|nr:ComF family protein [Deltaproteobacteria bacterium]
LGICTTCALKLPERKNGFCRSCGEFIDLGDGLCSNCLQNPPPWKSFYFYGAYAGYMRELLHQVKFSQGLHQAEALGKLLAAKLLAAKLLAARLLAEPSALTAAYDCIIPVPLHKDSLRERGFNQSALLAGPVSRQLNIPLRQKLLIKNRATPTQHGLSRKLRLKNMQGVFSAGKVNNLRILLLDDVLTTGATLRCASLCLLQAGAERVDTAVLARTPKK